MVSESTKAIITKIAIIQMNALKSIIESPENNDYELLVKLIGVKPGDIVQAASNLYDFYSEVSELPQLISMASEYQLSVCSHILFRMEDEWIQENPEGVLGAWNLIQLATSRFHPEFTLII